MEEGQLSALSSKLLSAFEGAQKKLDQEGETRDTKITVNPVVSEVASWYEKLRTAMDYRADEVILRAAIERILKRRLLFGANAKTVAEPFVRELIWARYFPDASVPEAIIVRVEETVNLYLTLRSEILKKHSLRENVVDEWIYHLLSSELENLLNPNIEEETMRNFMFQILKESIHITDDSQETRDAQVFIAVGRAFANDDTAFLRYHLFRQFFEKLTFENVHEIAEHFLDYYNEVNKQLRYPLKDRIYSYVKNQTPPFLILTDILHTYNGQVRELLQNADNFASVVFNACEARYVSIVGKVRRAIIRSVVFLILTKAIFALVIEGAYETYLTGSVSWTSMSINISIPPLLMIIVGLFIKTPGRDNSESILWRIDSLLFDNKPKLSDPLVLTLIQKSRPILNTIFVILWIAAILASLGGILFVLSKLNFHIVSQGVFIFFLTIVSFLSYRISQTAHIYTIEEKQSIAGSIVDFFFIPIIQVGRRLTEGIAQLNLVLFIFDFIIETPFKGIFAFFEQWFVFLRRKREELG